MAKTIAREERQLIIGTKVSPAEKERIDAAANALGLSRSAMLRRSALAEARRTEKGA